MIQKLEINKLRAQGTAVPEDYASRIKKLDEQKSKDRERRKTGAPAPKKPRRPEVLRYIRRGQKKRDPPFKEG